jgi:hypothetical protein
MCNTAYFDALQVQVGCAFSRDEWSVVALFAHAVNYRLYLYFWYLDMSRSGRQPL